MRSLCVLLHPILKGIALPQFLRMNNRIIMPDKKPDKKPDKDSTSSINRLPFSFEVETRAVLKQLAKSERALGELKGVTQKAPNADILMRSLFLQEAKASSEIENMVTTHDEVFRSASEAVSPNAKAVQHYNQALNTGLKCIQDHQLLTNTCLKQIQSILVRNDAGFRTHAGTTLKDGGGNIVYTPPQNAKQIEDLMQNLEAFIHDDALCDWNPLVKMAVIHHQFESIHPFYDGNGRTGRIINLLYLSLKGLLDLPVLYLSRYIIDHKADLFQVLIMFLCLHRVASIKGRTKS